MKIFIAGPRAIRTLNKVVKKRIENIMRQDLEIIVGDANGVDKQVQQFCFDNNYSFVKVFASNGKARNNIGEWEVVNVEVDSSKKGFDFYAAKDLEMVKVADYGFMIWNGKSRGTLNNIYNLIEYDKRTLVYLTKTKEFYTIKSANDIKILKKNPELLNQNPKNENKNNLDTDYKQITLF